MENRNNRLIKEYRISHLLSEYKNKKDLYGEFCLSLSNILKNLLEEDNLKYQLNYRVKTEESLKEKIIRKISYGKVYKKLSDIEDLAGIRIIFYNEQDKKKIIQRLYQEFEKGNVKIEHHAQRKGYKATHAVITLDRKRLRHTEYSQFRGLKCEVQITSILYHAWAEFEHDIFYKTNSNLIKDKKTFLIYKKKLQDALLNYIDVAARELDEIAKKTVVKNLKKT